MKEYLKTFGWGLGTVALVACFVVGLVTIGGYVPEHILKYAGLTLLCGSFVTGFCLVVGFFVRMNYDNSASWYYGDCPKEVQREEVTSKPRHGGKR